jgi:DNA polymerase II small subunit
MGNRILDLFMSRGFLLERGVLDFLSGMREGEIVGVVDRLVEEGIRDRVIRLEHLGFLRKSEIGNRKSRGGIRLLSDVKFLSRGIGVRDFVQHFRGRYEVLRDRLDGRVEGLSSLRRIGRNGGVYGIVVMVVGKRVTKNGNLLIEVEDLTGRSVVLVNKENGALFGECESLMLDDVVAFRVSGSSDMLFANEVVSPEVGLESERFGAEDCYVVFSGDLHVGSSDFLEGNFLRFVSWLNGEVGDERQRALAAKVRYLVLTGNLVDGVGVYPGQEKWLDIKNMRGQYRKVAELLGRIRGDVEIVACAGQHDAVWVGEPQRRVSEKWANGLYEMSNLAIVPNPSLVDIGGFKILMYHGASINRFIDEMNYIRVEFGHRSPTRVVREMLKRGHLAPTHGLMDYVPCEVDPMVIETPDIIATGGQHRAEVDSYNNVLMVASSCWQAVTPFEEKVGNVPDPCKVPLFNLKTREVKVLDFSEEKIKWEEGDGLSCDLEVGDENSD